MRLIDLDPTQIEQVRLWCVQDESIAEMCRQLGVNHHVVERTIKHQGFAYAAHGQYRGPRSQRGQIRGKINRTVEGRRSQQEYLRNRVISEATLEKLRRPKKNRGWSPEAKARVMALRRERGTPQFARNSKAEYKAAPLLALLGYRHTAEKQFFVNHPNGSRKLPDFVNRPERKVVEIWGEYWHRNDNPQDWIDWYNTALEGPWECIIVWTKQLDEYLQGLEGVVSL